MRCKTNNSVGTAPNRNIRYSRQREIIFNYLCGTKEHPSAEMIYEVLKVENPNLSLGTVYRNLKLLEEMDKIQRVTTVDNSERYDACCESHAHFVCENCGRVTDLSVINVKDAEGLCNVENAKKISKVSIVFTGTCEECI